MIWNKNLNEFFVSGRHLRIVVIITTQHVTGIGPKIRGNMDLVVIQPIKNMDARKELHKLYGGDMDYKTWDGMMNAIVLDENKPGSTPQEPDKIVRTMIVNDFENSNDPQLRFRWWCAQDPGEFRMLHPDYWKEDTNSLQSTAAYKKPQDPCDQLDEIQLISKFNFE